MLLTFDETRFPESRWPGRFDLIAASHQLFHGFVVLGAAVHLYGISTAFEWNYENPRCPSFHPYPVEDFEW